MPDFLNAWDRQKFIKYNICPILENGSIIRLYVCKNSDLSVISYLSFKKKQKITIEYLSEELLETKVREQFGIHQANNGRSQVSKNHMNETAAENPSIVRLINGIINTAVSIGASDIHFEPFETRMLCRFRIDGSLRQDREITKESVAEAIARLKIMSNLDISEKRRPQDGRIRFNTGSKVVDIRISFLPTDFGEKAVLRILDKENLRLDLGLLGLDEAQRALLEDKIQMPNGMILVTGPTGSGKTTTLYAMLNHLKSPKLNITTIEDPIEYNLDGINQTHVRPEINLTFGNALRAILRQDPNIIMVGEIRDRETLDQAIRASLTGHLVLSTLHTNNSVATISRMLDLGAESYLIGSTLKLIIAQRLVQTICPNCKQKDVSVEQQTASRKLGGDANLVVYSGRGCDYCGNTGFKGRKAIYEFLAIDDKLGTMVSDGANASQIESYAKTAGFLSLKLAGLALIKNGETTPLEVLKVIAG
ncbi:MAG: GspE/PulE family protein [Candidatus Zixiibacteriota bacterium]